jgi:tetratricopeptide (TPR) repeat protein
VSYDALPRVVPDGPGRPGGPDPARLFRLLGLPGAVELGLPAIAALADEPAGDVAAALESLTDAHMLESPAAERFRLHDLLRRYAAELAEAAVSPGDRSGALRRILSWYRDQAIIAARVLAPGRSLPVSAADRPGIAAIASSAQALDWFETERASLVAAVCQAAELGWHDVAAQIAVAMWGFFQCTHHDQDWLPTSQAGVSSARHMADDAVLSWLLNRLGQVHTLRREFADSRRCLTEALDLRRRAGDRSGMAKVLNSLAIDLHYQDRFEDALDCLESALATHVDLGERPDAAVIMSNIGETLRRLDRHDEALDQLRHALAIWHETGDRYGAGVAENGLGDVCLDLGRFQDAVDHYQRALAAHEGIMREHTDQANILYNLGRALQSLGRVREARDAWRAAVPILERNNDPRAADLRARIDEAAAPH